MARIKKLSRKQLKDLKNQVRNSRENEILETAETEEEALDLMQQAAIKKDKMGFSRDDRNAISEKIRSLDKKNPIMTWNYEPGSLVTLPNGEVGMIVKNEATNIEVTSGDYDMKKSIKQNRYAGQVFVVTSRGNNWYYPAQLKNIKE